MGFRFVYMCDILDKLERYFRRQIPILTKDLNARVNSEATEWFKRHRASFDAWDTNAPAVLYMLRPEQQHDRIYGIDGESLQRIIARALKLSRQQYQELQQWKESESVDLAGFVQRVMRKIKHIPPGVLVKSVMVEEIDQVLLRIAAFNPGSSAEVRDLKKTWESSDEVELLGSLYQRLGANEAKWLTRLILKDFSPVQFPSALSMTAGQSHLPRFLNINVQVPSSASSAVRQIGTGTIRGMASSNPAPLPTPLTSSALPPMVATPTVVTAQVNIPRLPALPETPQRTIEHSNKRNVVCISSRRPSASQNTPGPTLSRLVLGGISVNVPRASQQKSPPSSSLGQTASALCISGHGICRLSPDVCKLAGCLVLVSPCVASTPWLMDDLLPQHGARIITSLSLITHPSLPRHCPVTGKRYRKIALVESNRAEHTAAYMKKIGRLNLKRKGKKEWVEVYDWRLLECFTKVEQGRDTDYDPWKRCWIGAV